jgi:uncharacterized membrane protein
LPAGKKGRKKGVFPLQANTHKEEGGMRSTRVLIAALIVLVGLNLWGCCGSSKEVVVPQSQTTTTTLGQELQDLEEAYKKGTITKDEYEAAKKKIIEQRTKENK